MVCVVEIEEVRGEHPPLRYPKNHSAGRGNHPIVANRSGPPPKEGAEPTDDVRMKVDRGKTVEQVGVVYPVECFGQIGRGNHSAEWGFPLIEARSDFGGKWERGSNSGPPVKEAVLEGSTRKRGAKERKDKSLKDLRGRAKKGNWAEGSAYIKGFVRLGDRED